MKILNCIGCGVEVQLPTRSNTMRTYCSRECRIRDRDMKKQQPVEITTEGICKKCGAAFEQKPTGRTKEYCSNSCSRKHWREIRAEQGKCSKCSAPARPGYATCEACRERHSAWMAESRQRAREQGELKEGHSKTTCIICNEEFQKTGGYQIICGNEECRKARYNQIKRDKRGKAKQPIECQKCQQVFMPKRINQIYCSVRCQQVAGQDRKTIARRERAEDPKPTALQEWNRIVKEHELCRLCPRDAPSYAVPGIKVCAYHQAVAKYNRAAQLGDEEDDWKPRMSDYTRVPFDIDNPLTDEEVEARFVEDRQFETDPDIAAMLEWGPRQPPVKYISITPRERLARGVSFKAQSMLLVGCLPDNVLLHRDGTIECTKKFATPMR